MILPITPPLLGRQTNIARGLRDIAIRVPARLIRVLNILHRIIRPDLEIRLLDLGQGIVIPERKHSSDSPARPPGPREHADGQVPIVHRPGLDLGRGLEILVPHRAHHEVRLRLRPRVVVVLDVDVVRGVHHQYGPVAARDV